MPMLLIAGENDKFTTKESKDVEITAFCIDGEEGTDGDFYE